MSASAQAAKKERDRQSDAAAAARADQEIEDNPSSPAELLKADDAGHKGMANLLGDLKVRRHPGLGVQVERDHPTTK